MNSILIANINFNEQNFVSNLASIIKSIFNTEVNIDNNPPININDFYDPIRQQYHSTSILESLINAYNPSIEKIIGLVSSDLFIPIFTFVFGEAQLSGNAAIVSSFRLTETFYGLPESKDLTQSRLIKESIHELGHTFGFTHCPNYKCVMSNSTSVENIDLKSHTFCKLCEKQYNTQILNI